MASRQAVRLERTLLQDARRKCLAETHSDATSTRLDTRWWLDRNVGVVSAQRISLLLSFILRLQARITYNGRLLGQDPRARDGTESVSRGISAVRRRSEFSQGSDRSLSGARGILLQS